MKIKLPKNPIFRAGLQEYARHNYRKSVELFNRCLLGGDEDHIIYYYIARSYFEADDTSQARLHYNKALDIEPHFHQALLAGAYTDLLTGNSSLAIHKYTKLIKLGVYVRSCKGILNRLKLSGPEKILLEKKRSFFLGPLTDWKAVLRFHFLSWLPATVIIITILVLFPHFKSCEGLRSNTSDYAFMDTSYNRGETVTDGMKEILLFEDPQRDEKTPGSHELVRLWKDIKKNIDTGDVNRAIILKNQVINAPVNPYIKERFGILGQFIPVPGFVDFPLSQSASTFAGNADYRDIYVKYRGIMGKPRKGDDEVIFNFSVQDKESGEISDTLQVVLDTDDPLALKQGERYELFGQYKGVNKRNRKVLIKGLVVRAF